MYVALLWKLVKQKESLILVLCVSGLYTYTVCQKHIPNVELLWKLVKQRKVYVHQSIGFWLHLLLCTITLCAIIQTVMQPVRRRVDIACYSSTYILPRPTTIIRRLLCKGLTIIVKQRRAYIHQVLPTRTALTARKYVCVCYYLRLVCKGFTIIIVEVRSPEQIFPSSTVNTACLQPGKAVAA